MKRLLIDDRGGVLVRILMLLVTLLLIGGTLYLIVYTQQQNQQNNHRKAQAISEYGLMMALQKLYQEPSWQGGFDKTPYDGGWYRVTLHHKSDSSIRLIIVSEGAMGSVSSTKEAVLSLSIKDNDSSWVRESIR